MRVTGAMRKLRRDPVPLELVYRVLENARFAPNGGNRQGWHVIVVTDLLLRKGLQQIYATAFDEYAHDDSHPERNYLDQLVARGDPIEQRAGRRREGPR